MKKIDNIFRAKKLIEEFIAALKLDLSSMTVLTEAASGNFIVTPLIAAAAGADRVYVVSRDSGFGTREEIREYLYESMAFFHIPDEKICWIDNKEDVAESVNVVTNLGFVRPLSEAFIEKLPYDAAIPLMFESWEFRDSDIDLSACRRHKIPVLGTRETHQGLQIFSYVGMSVLKLLLENGIEVFKSHILLVSSGEYLKAVRNTLTQNGAVVKAYNPYEKAESEESLEAFLKTCDAVVVAEQRHKDVLIGKQGRHINIQWLSGTGALVIHIAGLIDYELLEKNQIRKVPPAHVQYGYMTVTTEYVGIRPVIELHAAGLKVGQAMVEGLRQYRDVDQAKHYALRHSPAMEFEGQG